MRIGEVIGRVVLSQCLPEFAGARFQVLRPYDLDALVGATLPSGESVVAYEQLGARDGMQVAFSEGREAAMPFHPARVAVDAYVACLLDAVQIAPSVVAERKGEKHDRT